MDLEQLIRTVGYIGLFGIIFAESGLFFGFFFPGDSLLLTAGLLASRHELDIRILFPLLFVAAVTGDTVGYWFGAKTGPLLFRRPRSLFFRPEYLHKAQVFYERHGGKTITLARFLPVIRTFAPIVAGAARMRYRRFLLYNVVGGLAWAVGVTYLGYFLGRVFGSIEGVDRYFTLLVIAFFIIPGLPTLIHLWKEQRHEVWAWIRSRVLRRPVEADPEEHP